MTGEADAMRSVLRWFLSLALISCVNSAAGQASSIDTAHSRLLVHVYKTGIFARLADNHEVQALIDAGTLDVKNGQLRLSVDSRQMEVLDPQLPPDKRRQVWERMLGPEVLDSFRYPEIRFESTHADFGQNGEVFVAGRLSLHGVTKLISLVAHSNNGRYTGTFALKQSDFNIVPISVAGGTVKVKDELTIDFDIAALPGEREN